MRFLTLLLLPLLCFVSNSVGQPAPDRPSDELLQRPALQAVVEAQVARDGSTLTNKLRADVPAVRARAAFALASVQDTTAVDRLLARLQDGVPLVRTDAAFALGQMPPSAVPSDSLLETLRQERDVTMQRSLIETLGKTGDRASLRALMEIGLPAARHADLALAIARYGMRDITDATASEWLVERLTSPDAWTRRNTAYAMGRVPSLANGSADSIRHALETYTPDDPAAMHLIRAVGRLDAPTDIDRLTRWLSAPPDWRTRVNAARALRGLPDTAAVRTALVRALKDPHPLVARTAATTLAARAWSKETRTAVGIWIEAHPDRWRIIAPLRRGLAQNGRSDQALRAVRTWGRDRSPVAYATLLPALGPVDNPQADSLLFDALQSDDPRIAAAAVRTIIDRWTRIRPRNAAVYFEELSAAVRRGDPAILYHGASALTDSAFVARGAADTLAATYETLNTPEHLEGMTSILEALGAIGDGTSRSVLERALDHPHHAIRRAAAAGLSTVTDSTVIPDPTPLPGTPAIDWDHLQALGPHPQLHLETSQGEVTIKLDTEQAPHTVQAITRIAQNGRYDGVPFHRVVPNFVVQGGDFARGDGFGSAGFTIRTEITRIRHRRGTIGMASAGKDTESSQFFIPHSMQPHLDSGYTSFGRVIEGMDVVDSLRKYDTIQTATVRADDD